MHGKSMLQFSALDMESPINLEVCGCIQ